MNNEKILNPRTGRMVLKKGKIGQQVLRDRKREKERLKPIAQGAYGCVYSPHLECKRSGRRRSYNEVSKLAKPSSVVDELKIAKVLNQIDPDQKRFIYISDSCAPKEDLKVLKRKGCRIIENGRSYRNYFMRNGGYDLLRWYNDFPLSDFVILSTMKKVLKNLIYLHKANIVHGDLSLQNILMDTNYVPRIIDFGLGLDLDEGIPSNIFDFEYANERIPPAFNPNEHKYPQKYISKFRDFYSLMKEYETLYDRYGKKQYFNSVIKPNIKKVDSFAFGWAFLKIVKDKEVRKILYEMIDPDITRQITVNQAYSRLKNL